jgi:lysylphosphatidylglycerol synthetase-like protein (DUF2156 family)
MAQHASTLALGTLGIAVLLVVLDPLWKATAGPLVVLFEQVGHGIVTLLSGRWVTEIKLERGKDNPRGSTRTTKEDDPFKPPRIAFSLAGYATPPIVGLVLARGVQRDWDPSSVLVTLLVIVGIVALFHRTFWTLVVVVLSAAVLAAFFWRAGPGVQWGAVVVLAWIFLIGGLRRVLYLVYTDNPRTDASVLQDLTGIPSYVWVGVFGVIALAALITGARWLLTYA